MDKHRLLQERRARWSRQKEIAEMMSSTPATQDGDTTTNNNQTMTSTVVRRTYEAENASNALNMLTEKIARRLRDELEADPDVLKHRERNQLAAKKDASQRAQAASSYQCGICFELLMGDRYPKIIVPCGHTFCAMCLDHHMKVNARNCVCPYCRAKIELTAVNHHLRQLVEAYAADRQVGTTVGVSTSKCNSNSNGGGGGNSSSSGSDGGLGVGGGGVAGARYLREYNMLKTRRRILRQEQTETRDEVQRLRRTLQTHTEEEKKIRLEEQQAAADVEAAKKRLGRVRARLEEQQVLTESVKEKQDLADTKLEMIRSTLQTIGRDADKAHVLASAQQEDIRTRQ